MKTLAELDYDELHARAVEAARLPALDDDGEDYAGLDVVEAEVRSGYGQVAVTGDAWMRARANMYLAGLPDPPRPLDALRKMTEDERELVLLQALYEIDLDNRHLRAFDPSKHKRWPKGHPLAGKFRPMVDLLKMAIAAFDPKKDKHPFENFTRPQLLKVAKERGISLKKGEDKDSIADKLLADLNPNAKAPKPKQDDEISPLTGQPVSESAWAQKAAGVFDTMKPTPAPKKTPVKKAPSKKSPVEAGDFSGLVQVEGQAGTTPGGVFEDADGTRWYVKAQQSAAHANNEALASALYRAAGIDVPAVVRGKGAPGLSGENHTATRMVDGAFPNLDAHLAMGDNEYLSEIRMGFAVDAWLANWDVVGEGSENPLANIVQGADDKPHRIDVGGALLFRGKGGEKGDLFGPQVVEFDTMRDPTKGRKHSQVFAATTDDELFVSIGRVKAVTPAKIRKLVAEHGMDSDLADLLIARRKDVLSRANAAKKVSKPSKASKGWDGAATGSEALAAAPVKITASVSGTRALLQKAGLKPDDAQWATLGFEDYQDGQYGSFNKALMKAAGGPLDKDYLDSDDIEKIRAMEKAMAVSRLTEDVIVYRGERAPARSFAPGAWSMTGGMEGMEWTFHAFGSSSADAEVAENFAAGPTSAPKEQAQPTIMRILARKGTQGVHLQGSMEGEQELLLARSLKYRVVKDHGVVDGFRKLDVEVVPS